MFGIKKKKGPRTADMVNAEYQRTAIQAGHVGRMIYQFQKEIDKLEIEFKKCVTRLDELNVEGSKWKDAPSDDANPPPLPPTVTLVKPEPETA
jgi:hypothetical protein